MNRTSSIIMFSVCSIALFVGGCEFFNRMIPENMHYKSCGCTSCKHKHGHDHDHHSHHGHGNSHDNDVAIKINNKVVATQGDFVEFVNQAIKATPYLGTMGIKEYKDMNRDMLEQLLDSLVKQKLIVQWGYDNRINRSPDFVEKRRKMIDQVEQLIIAQEFEKRLSKKISLGEDELTQAYEKDKQHLVKDAGSVEFVGCLFTAQKDADRFYDAIAGKSAEEFKKSAERSSGKLKDFGKLSKDPRAQFMSAVPAKVRSAVMTLDRTGASQVVQDGEDYWVVLVTTVHEPIYATFAEVRDHLHEKVRVEKLQQLLQSELSELQSKYAVEQNKDFLPEQPAMDTQSLQALLQAAEQNQSEKK